MILPAFQQSVFLQSLGWAIANSLWQGALIWILYKIIVSSYNNAPAKFKNNLSTALLFSSFLWFILTFFTRIAFANNNTPDNIIDHYYTNVNVNTHSPGLSHFMASSVIILPYLSVAYLLLLLIFAVKLINAYSATNFIKNNGLSKPDIEWRMFVEKVINHIGVSKTIKIWYSKYVDVPATIGFFKPVILIPLASLNQITAYQMEAVILHEISHIKRNDYLVNLFVSLVETILFFNPFVLLLGRIIKKERENCCDDFVLQYQYDRYSYASALFALEQTRVQQHRLALSATSGRQQLLSRIKRIMDVKTCNDGIKYGQKLLALFLSTAILFCIAWLIPQKPTNLHSGKNLPALKSNNVTINGANNSVKSYKEENKTTAIITKPLREQKLNSPVSRTVTGIKSSEKNFVTPGTNQGKEKKVPFTYLYNNKITKPDIYAEENLLNTDDNNFESSPNVFQLLSDQKLLENLHLNLEVNKLKEYINKGNQLIGSLKPPEVEINIHNKIINAIRDIEAKESDLKNAQLNIEKIYNNVLDNQLPFLHNDSLIVSPDVDPADFFFNEPAPDKLRTLRSASLKRRTLQTVKKPSFPEPVSVKRFPSPPKMNFPPKPSIWVDAREGFIVINGEKINLSQLSNLKVKKFTKDFKRLHRNEIEL